jgi:hypothetical protein
VSSIHVLHAADSFARVSWKRSVLVAALVNFAAMFWFAQYLVSGWLVYLYMVGSLAVLCLVMVVAE